MSLRTLSDATQIFPGLWLGSIVSAQRSSLLKQVGITHVISCLSYREVAEQNLDIPSGIQWTIIPVEETDSIFPHIETVVNTIGNELRRSEGPLGRATASTIGNELRRSEGPLGRGGRILIHCMSGISRSPAFAASYIIWRLRLRWVAALAYVRERRACSDPSPQLLDDIRVFDRAVFRDETLPTVPNKNR
jgi:hypothetical protein